MSDLNDRLAEDANHRDQQEGYSPREARWFNVFDEEVDLDNIDREYALNILSMYTLNSGIRLMHSHDSIKNDPLVKKLRSVILNGRKPTMRDRARAFAYNIRCVREGKPFRAPVR